MTCLVLGNYPACLPAVYVVFLSEKEPLRGAILPAYPLDINSLVLLLIKKRNPDCETCARGVAAPKVLSGILRDYRVDRNLVLYLPRLNVFASTEANRPRVWFPGTLEK